jgi:hypothetical protein
VSFLARITNRSIAFVAAGVMLGLGLAGWPARADDSIGSVTQIAGSAQIQRGGATLAAKQATPVKVYDKVTTQPGASTTLRLATAARWLSVAEAASRSRTVLW